MFSSSTKDIRVSVIPEYDAKNSYPAQSRYVFKYNIFIENFGSVPVKLLKRKWLIYDLGFGFTEVSGEGVIGLLPEITPDNNFSYFSNVILSSGIGHMSGTYLFEDINTGETFEAEIPRFDLVASLLGN